jgi:hypothetical protein
VARGVQRRGRAVAKVRGTRARGTARASAARAARRGATDGGGMKASKLAKDTNYFSLKMKIIKHVMNDQWDDAIRLIRKASDTKPPSITKEEWALIKQGKFIEVIKAYRARTNLGLKELVEAVKFADDH